ncbi:MAG: bifunctional nicotinamidase/pyrazinamidase [Algoriphagus sp.]|uniref:bifunctional nicotinamidase/pyrazinamidase n=1 Tax=Algoriphagus sp. TaxID=1872435 RepID=UPI001823BA97|nr:bifunctional nicotinamidase/pyrazinamidase [Algoriphagus sp.]NVJ87298.1 bifunctional nicotinamidase/pyrazinamidase [Algoriphagus sp.]
MKKSNKEALIIVDVQYDFLPGGALAVSEGDQIIPVINQIQPHFEFIVATQDWHPKEHLSFAANHSEKNPGELIDLDGISQVLWPVHCVQGTEGATFHEGLDRSNWKRIFQKGTNPRVDSYSGFFDNARRGDTGLAAFLQDHGIQRIFVCGLALDYCVKFTALDGLSLGFDTYLIQDATKAVNLDAKDGEKALDEMSSQGIQLIDSSYFQS